MTTTTLEQQIAAIEAQLTKLNASAERDEQKVLEAIKQQRWWFLKNQPDIVFDSHTGFLWAKAPPLGEEGWEDVQFEEMRRQREMGNPVAAAAGSSLMGLVVGAERERVFMHRKHVSQKFSPANKTYNRPYERERIVLNHFLQENWIPVFANAELQDAFERLAITRPQLERQLVELKQQLAAATPTDQPLSAQFDYRALLADYDPPALDAAPLAYARAVQSWVDCFLLKLDDFAHEQSSLLQRALDLRVRLSAPLTPTLPTTGPLHALLATRHAALQTALDFGLDRVRAHLLNVHEQGQHLEQQLKAAANQPTVLADWAALERQPRPTFANLAAYVADEVIAAVNRLEWFSAYEAALTTLAQTHLSHLAALDLLLDKEHSDFRKQGQREQIDSERLETWFAAWQQARLQLEETLWPLMHLGLTQHLDLTTVTAVVDALTDYRMNLDDFYRKERMAIHQKYAFIPNGDLQEQFETEIEVFKLKAQLQQTVEAILFGLKDSAKRVRLLRWSEWLFSGQVMATQALLEDRRIPLEPTVLADIATSFRQLQQRNLEAFLRDAQHFAAMRKERDDEYNSLVFRMRKELMKPKAAS